MNEFIAERINNALQNIKNLLPEYWEATILSRTPGKSVGSVFDFEDVEKVLFEDRINDWTVYENCPNLIPGCTAFILRNVDGHLGVVELGKLDPEMSLDIVDNKKTGKAKLLAHIGIGPEVDYAVMILGEEQGREVIFTFHPGQPVRPSEIPIEALEGKTRITVREAMALGFTTANVVE